MILVSQSNIQSSCCWKALPSLRYRRSIDRVCSLSWASSFPHLPSWSLISQQVKPYRGADDTASKSRRQLHKWLDYWWIRTKYHLAFFNWPVLRQLQVCQLKQATRTYSMEYRFPIRAGLTAARQAPGLSTSRRKTCIPWCQWHWETSRLKSLDGIAGSVSGTMLHIDLITGDISKCFHSPSMANSIIMFRTVARFATWNMRRIYIRWKPEVPQWNCLIAKTSPLWAGLLSTFGTAFIPMF